MLEETGLGLAGVEVGEDGGQTGGEAAWGVVEIFAIANYKFQ